MPEPPFEGCGTLGIPFLILLLYKFTMKTQNQIIAIISYIL
jgi:hypothetical protein